MNKILTESEKKRIAKFEKEMQENADLIETKRNRNELLEKKIDAIRYPTKAKLAEYNKANELPKNMICIEIRKSPTDGGSNHCEFFCTINKNIYEQPLPIRSEYCSDRTSYYMIHYLKNPYHEKPIISVRLDHCDCANIAEHRIASKWQNSCKDSICFVCGSNLAYYKSCNLVFGCTDKIVEAVELLFKTTDYDWITPTINAFKLLSSSPKDAVLRLNPFKEPVNYIQEFNDILESYQTDVKNIIGEHEEV